MGLLVSHKSRPDYGNWLSRPQEFEASLVDGSRVFMPEELGDYLRKQAAHAEQSLVELTSNGLDAVDAWINRFGLGFYQALGELQDDSDRVIFAGETEEGKRIGVVFRKTGNGAVQFRPMRTEELNGYLKDLRATTIVSVRKKLTAKQQEEYKRYLRDRVEGNQRMRVVLNGEEVNRLSDFSLSSSGVPGQMNSEAKVVVGVDSDGYQVANPGKINPETIFERLIVPHQGRPASIDRQAAAESPLARPRVLLRDNGLRAGDNVSSKISIQIAEMGVEVFELSGIGISSRAFIKLPGNISLDMERGRIKIDAKYEQAMRVIIDDIARGDDLSKMALIANTLWAYWSVLDLEDGVSRGILSAIKDYMNQELAKSLLRLQADESKAALPALPMFSAMQLSTRTQKVYFYPELFSSIVAAAPGMERVGQEFRSDTGMQLYHVAYQPGVAHPAIFQVGKMVIIDRELFKWAHNDPWRRALVNWWLTYQVGYGKPREELGWWGDEQREKESDKNTEFFDLMPGLLSDRPIWQLWAAQGRFGQSAGHALFTSQEIKDRLSGWNKWVAQVFPGQENEALARHLWSKDTTFRLEAAENTSDNIRYLQERFFVIPDGRRVYIDDSELDNLSIMIESAPRSGRWIKKKVTGVSDKLGQGGNVGRFDSASTLSDGRLALRYKVQQETYIYFVQSSLGEGNFFVLSNKSGRTEKFHELYFVVYADPFGRLYMTERRSYGQRYMLLRESEPGSGRMEEIPYDGEGKYGLMVDFLEDGRLILNREAILDPVTTVSRSIWSFLPVGYQEKKLLKSRRILCGRSRYIDGKNCFDLQLETAPGSGSFKPVFFPYHFSKMPEYDPYGDHDFKKRTVHQFYIGEKEKRNLFILSKGGDKFTPILIKGRDDVLEADRIERVTIQEDTLGRLVIAISTNFSRAVRRCYRETDPGSGVVEAIELPILPQEETREQFVSGVHCNENGSLLLEVQECKAMANYGDVHWFDSGVQYYFEASGRKFVKALTDNLCFFHGTWFLIQKDKSAIVDMDTSRSPVDLTPADLHKIHNYLDIARNRLNSYERGRLFRNVSLLGADAVKNIQFAAYLDDLALKMLQDDVGVLLERSVKRNHNWVFTFLNTIVAHGILDPDRFNEYVRRWIELVDIDPDLAMDFLNCIEDCSEYLVDAGADIDQAPKHWRGLLFFFRDPEATIFPQARPNNEGDVFAKKVPSASLGTGPVPLALLLTLQQRRLSALTSTGPGLLDLSGVAAVLAEESSKPDLNTAPARDKINRMIRGQTGVYAVSVRGLVQRAREALRSSGMERSKIRVSAWFEGNKRIVRVSDPSKMSLAQLINTYLKQKNYNVWLEADRVRIRIGCGKGKSYAVELAARRGKDNNLDIDILRFDEYADDFEGTVIEEELSFDGKGRYQKLLSAVLLQEAVFRFCFDIRDHEVTFNTYNERPVAEDVEALGAISDDQLGGEFFVGWVKGDVSCVTHDGLEVHQLMARDWDGVPGIVRKQLEENGKILMRWPARIPLTIPQTGIALREIDPRRWQRMRFAAVTAASLKAFFQYDHWLPDLPQDVLTRDVYKTRDPHILTDAQKLNSGQWQEVDVSYYRDDERRFIELFILLEGRFSKGKTVVSLAALERTIDKLAHQAASRGKAVDKALERLKQKYPALAGKIAEAFYTKRANMQDDLRQRTREEEAIEGKPLDSSDKKRAITLIQALLGEFQEPGSLPRTAEISTSRAVEAFVSGWKPTVISFADDYLKALNTRLNMFSSGVPVSEEDVYVFLRLMDTIPHEYAHTEEFLESGHSSHLTHQQEGVLENSFPRRMQRIILRALENRWDLRQAIMAYLPGDGAAADKPLAPQIGKEEAVKYLILYLEAIRRGEANLVRPDIIYQNKAIFDELARLLGMPDEMRDALLSVFAASYTEALKLEKEGAALILADRENIYRTLIMCLRTLYPQEVRKFHDAAKRTQDFELFFGEDQEDQTQAVKKMHNGGIELNAEQMRLDVVNSGQGIDYTFDSAILQRLEDFNGLFPVIIDIEAMTMSVPMFLGLRDHGSL